MGVLRPQLGRLSRVEETKAIDHLHFTNRSVGLHDLLESLQEAGVWSGQETVFLS